MIFIIKTPKKMAKFDLKKYLKEGKLHKNKKTLNESCPGYDDRGFGDPLPTLDSIQQDYELSQSEEDEEIEHEEESEGDDATEILDDVVFEPPSDGASGSAAHHS